MYLGQGKSKNVMWLSAQNYSNLVNLLSLSFWKCDLKSSGFFSSSYLSCLVNNLWPSKGKPFLPPPIKEFKVEAISYPCFSLSRFPPLLSD